MAEDIYILSDAVIAQRIGGTIRRVRIAKHITQEQLALSAGVAVSSVRNIEQGKNIALYTLVPILRTLQLLDTLQHLIANETTSPVLLAAQMSAKPTKRQRAVARKTPEQRDTTEW